MTGLGNGDREMTSELAASVLIPTFNRRELLCKTLDSLVACVTESEPFEVIVSDDGSSDGTPDAVRSYADRLRLKYLWMPDEGFRAARARNLAARMADGEICIFCDSGVIALKGFVQAHIDAHVRGVGNYVVGYVHGITHHEDVRSRLRELLEPQISSTLAAAVADDRRLADPREPCYAHCEDDLSRLRAPWALFWTANTSIPLTTFREIGGFDENYRSWGVEDVDFALTAFRSGVPLRLWRPAAVVHHPHDWAEDALGTNRSNKLYLHRKFALPETALFVDTSAVSLNLTPAEEIPPAVG